MLKPAASGKPVSDPADRHTERSQNFYQVIGCGLTFDVRAKCKNDLGRTFLHDPTGELVDAEFVRPDVVQRRKASAERMVKTGKMARSFEREDIGSLLDHADLPARASWLQADLAEVVHRKKSAPFAWANGICCRRERVGELGRSGIFAAQQPKGDALCAARADARQTAKLAGQVAKRNRVVGRHKIWPTLFAQLLACGKLAVLNAEQPIAPAG